MSRGRSPLEAVLDGLPARPFFSILTRYRPSPDRLPEEDSLTQCFCGVVGAVPELAVAVASEWTGWEDLTPAGIRVDTQVSAPSGRRRIDLEMVFPDAGVALWIEVKHGSGLSGDQQLDDYWADLADAHPDSHRRALVFLPPAGFSLTADQRPPDDDANQAFVDNSDWQQTGTSVARWLACSEAPSLDHYLASHFLAFLREEGLFVTRGFTIDDHATLDRHHEAAAAFTHLISLVRDRVNRDRVAQGAVSDDKIEWPTRPRWGVLGTAWPRTAAPDEPWLEWQLNSWDSSTREEVWKFSAGLSATTADQLEGVRDALPAEYRSFLAGRHRLMKHLPLSDVEIEDDPELQVERVMTGTVNSPGGGDLTPDTL